MNIYEYIDYSLIDKFKPTIQWMQENYDKANRELFNGRLRGCKFEVSNLGLHTLGRFKCNVPPGHLYIDRRANNHMYYIEWAGNKKKYIDYNNFVEYCKPTIILSSIFSGTETVLYNTLVHEMCHYYTYMHGFAPKQGHGREFKDIASIVSYRSNGLITIQRLATSEEMEQHEMDADMQAKKDKLDANRLKRQEKQKTATNYYLIMKERGVVRLVKTDSPSVIRDIKRIETPKGCKILNVGDSSICAEFYAKGYRTTFRTYRFWGLSDTDKIVKKALESPLTKEI